jgi:ATP-dependent DNA helicase RecG
MHGPDADALILEGFGLDDLDEASVGEYRDRFAATKPKHPWLVLDKKALLEKLGCWRKNRNNGNYALTLAGLLMFPDGTWEANLFQFCQRVWPKLTADLQVPRPSKEAQSIDETPVHAALREAVINALVHTNYATPGGIVFERYRDRFRLGNPGTLLVSQEQLHRGGVSQCRNRSLQRMFMLIGGCDQAGAGYQRIRDGWWSQRWQEPHLSTQEQPDRVQLEFVMRTVLPEEIFATVGGKRRR